MHCIVSHDLARSPYRSGPDASHEAIRRNAYGHGLTIEDYRYEFRGEAAIDPAIAKWDDGRQWVSFDDPHKSTRRLHGTPSRCRHSVAAEPIIPARQLLTTAESQKPAKGLGRCWLNANDTIRQQTFAP